MALTKERQFRIDSTIKSAGKLLFFPRTTVRAGYLFRQSRRLLRFSLQRGGAQRAEIVGFQVCKGDSFEVFETYAVDSDCAQAKVSVLIDFTIRSVGLSFCGDANS